jgi:hypothetical protein
MWSAGPAGRPDSSNRTGPRSRPGQARRHREARNRCEARNRREVPRHPGQGRNRRRGRRRGQIRPRRGRSDLRQTQGPPMKRQPYPRWRQQSLPERRSPLPSVTIACTPSHRTGMTPPMATCSGHRWTSASTPLTARSLAGPRAPSVAAQPGRQLCNLARRQHRFQIHRLPTNSPQLRARGLPHSINRDRHLSSPPSITGPYRRHTRAGVGSR